MDIATTKKSRFATVGSLLGLDNYESALSTIEVGESISLWLKDNPDGKELIVSKIQTKDGVRYIFKGEDLNESYYPMDARSANVYLERYEWDTFRVNDKDNTKILENKHEDE